MAAPTQDGDTPFAWATRHVPYVDWTLQRHKPSEQLLARDGFEAIPLWSEQDCGAQEVEPVWRPIESAPKDGTHILGYEPYETRGYYIDAVHFWAEKWTIEWMQGYGHQPTGCPFPPHPQSKKSND